MIELKDIPEFKIEVPNIPSAYTWWSWCDTRKKWIKSCWKADTIADAIHKYVSPYCIELTQYHVKLIYNENGNHTDVLTIPARTLEIFGNNEIFKEFVKRVETGKIKNLSFFTDDHLYGELARRKEIKDKEELKTFTKICNKCKLENHLSEWYKVRTYTFTDDVYTQNYLIDNDFAIVCPNCCFHHWAKKEYAYSNPSEETMKDLELYKFCKKFETYGKFKQEYHRHEDEITRSYTYKIKNDTGKQIEVPYPFKQ